MPGAGGNGVIAITQDTLYERIYLLVRAIPQGKVTTYGRLAAMCALADARAGGDAMNASPRDVPWQRVSNARGAISLRGATGVRQRALLQAEGVVFDETDHVDFAVFGWVPDAAWLAANGYHTPPPLRKDKSDEKKRDGEQLSLF